MSFSCYFMYSFLICYETVWWSFVCFLFCLTSISVDFTQDFGTSIKIGSKYEMSGINQLKSFPPIFNAYIMSIFATRKQPSPPPAFSWRTFVMLECMFVPLHTLPFSLTISLSLEIWYDMAQYIHVLVSEIRMHRTCIPLKL